jgi:hypothetical protein
MPARRPRALLRFCRLSHGGQPPQPLPSSDRPKTRGATLSDRPTLPSREPADWLTRRTNADPNSTFKRLICSKGALKHNERLSLALIAVRLGPFQRSKERNGFAAALPPGRS